MAVACLLITSLASAQSTARVALWAKSLFYTGSTDEEIAAQRGVHATALRYVHTTPKGKLASDLMKVLARYGPNSPEGAGAEYLMAMHGIDTNKNARSLARIRQGYPPRGANEDTWSLLAESANGALYDIALRQHSSLAAALMIGARTDGDIAEGQEYDAEALFVKYPTLVVDAVAGDNRLRNKLLDELAFQADDPADQVKIQATARRRLRGARGNERSLLVEIAHISFEKRFGNF